MSIQFKGLDHEIDYKTFDKNDKIWISEAADFHVKLKFQSVYT